MALLVPQLSTLAPTANAVVVDGYYQPGDGGGGIFSYYATLPGWITWIDPADPRWFEDGGIVIKYTGAGGGYWIRTYSGPINVRWFGARGNGSNDTTAVEGAIHVAEAWWYPTGFKKEVHTTVYFPKGGYRGHFVITTANITGDGYDSTLYLTGTDSECILIKGGDLKISNIQIYGDSGRSGHGISFDPNNPNAKNVFFEGVKIVMCDYGIYKPSGNIQNLMENCTLYGNNVGFYAENAPTMHCGCDQFIRGHIQANELAGIVVIAGDPKGYGQLIIDGTVIENNYGFGLFMKITGDGMLNDAVSIRDVWMEVNTGSNSSGSWVPTSSVTIDGITYTSSQKQIVDYYFENVRSIGIYDSNINAIYLKASSANLYNCSSDPSGGNYYMIEVDSTSSLTAREHRYNGQTSEKIFVESISYDGSSDLKLANVATSVWSPLRNVVQTGTKNVMVAQRYDGTSYNFGYAPLGPTNILTTTQVPNGILKNVCAKLQSSSSTIIEVEDLPNSFDLNDSNPKYYVWSIHACLCLPNTNITGVYGSIGTDSTSASNVQLGQVILKNNQWVCSSGVKRLTGNATTPPRIYLHFGLKSNASVMFCDYQVVKFDNLFDATSFLSSRAFGAVGSPCP